MIGESTCFGDSGSPAFASSGAIVGVAARAGNGAARTDNMASSCIGPDAHAVYTHLDKFPDLINAAPARYSRCRLREPAEPVGVLASASTDPTGAPTAAGASSGGAPAGGGANAPVVNKDSANANVLGDDPGAPVHESKPEAGGCSTRRLADAQQRLRRACSSGSRSRAPSPSRTSQ